MKQAMDLSCGLRCSVLALLLLAGSTLPAAANEMWQALFDDHLENARGGDPEAQYEVGIMYLKGQGVEQNRDKAMEWLKAAADAGHPLAGSKLTRIDEQEDKFRELRAQADDGDPEARYEVAMMYLKGRGVEADGATALRYLEKGAEAGDVKAATRLGIVLHKGEAGVTDHKRARDLLQSVSGDSVLAQYYLGEIYASGAGVKQDYEQAIEWYRKAAEGGFNRASGKIINLEEEIKVQQRRQAGMARAAQRRRELARLEAKQEAERRARQQAQRQAALAREAQARRQAEQARKAAVAKSAVPAPAPVSAPEPPPQGLDRLTSVRWLRDERPVDYLPSRVTECDKDDKDKDKLVCLSQVRQRTAGTKVVEYRVKSIISADNENYAIVYRNLVLDVTDAEVADDEPLGYDDQVSKGYRIKTGWTPEHRVVCRPASGQRMDCDKDDRYQITLVGEN